MEAWLVSVWMTAGIALGLLAILAVLFLTTALLADAWQMVNCRILHHKYHGALPWHCDWCDEVLREER